MSLIVLLEPRLQRVDHFGDSNVEQGYVEGVRAIHAAEADPSVPGDQSDHTLCGERTGRMQRSDYHPSSPGATWYPPRWHGSGLVCSRCDEIVHAT
ncbi:hypothetical protein ACIGZJ_36310 [Kitasatospora sp. NPDC052868]|uniref:hypothetical protein n=1 Tax=Kitasatospora sp. NPDC052868 TaxID=3364060 RepID=UPI0037C88268